MANQRFTPHTRSTPANVTDILEHMQLKYALEPMNAVLVEAMTRDLNAVNNMSGTTDEAEDSLEMTKKFLMTKINLAKNKETFSYSKNFC